MKNFVTVISNIRVNQLACCSTAVLMAACGGGAADIDTGQQNQTAPLSYDSATSKSGAAVAAADDSRPVAIPSSTEATSSAGTGGPTHLLATSTEAAAGPYHLYVATDGADSNPGTKAAPFKTIARADSRAGAGYTIHVAPGTYKVSAPSKGSVGIRTSKSGTPSARIKFVSDVKWGAKLVMSGTGILWNSRGSYVDIDGFDLSGSGRMGILAEGGYLTINNNFIHDFMISGGCNGGGGAAIDTYGPVGNAVIDGNVVKNIGQRFIAGGTCNTVQGIYISNKNILVTNNIVSGVAAVGIQQWHSATASTIVNNTVFHNKVGILVGQGDRGVTPGGSQNNYVANNIVYDNMKFGVMESGKVGGNNRYVNNLVHANRTNWRVKGTVRGSITAHPLFVDYRANGTGDYRVQSGSPAIDRGTASRAPATDILLKARPEGAAVDIGAYELPSARPDASGGNLDLLRQ